MKKSKKTIVITVSIVFFLLLLTSTTSAYRLLGIEDTLSNPVQSIVFTSQGAPPQKTCELIDESAINRFMFLLKTTPTIKMASIRGGGGIVNANIVLADGSQHRLQVYTSNFAAMSGTGVIIASPRNFAKQVLNYVALCPDSWI